MRQPLLALVAGSLLFLLAGSAQAERAPHLRSAASSAVQASGSEFRIGLSRSRVQPGSLRLEFVNFGEDDHDLAIRRVGNQTTDNVGLTHPGDRNVKRLKVRRGAYMLWCTISDHRARGMRATLKVSSKKKR